MKKLLLKFFIWQKGKLVHNLAVLRHRFDLLEGVKEERLCSCGCGEMVFPLSDEQRRKVKTQINNTRKDIVVCNSFIRILK